MSAFLNILSAVLILSLSNVACDAAKSEQEVLNDWISSLSPESINYYQQNEPDRLRTSYENMAIDTAYLETYRLTTKYGVEFAQPFTNNTMLQREPQRATIYGLSSKPNVEITLEIKNDANGQKVSQSTTSMHNGDWKILLPHTYPNGGSYTLTVQCPDCGSITTQTILNVTFGDVYLCSGQSNMKLFMHHTFNRNYTKYNITKLGKYKNIRFIKADKLCISDDSATYATPIDYDESNGVQDSFLWTQSYNLDLLDYMAAPCWYFAETLSDKYGMSEINIGLVSTAQGGSIIESWIKNHTIDDSCNKNDQYPVSSLTGCLYNGNVLPFINYTIKAALWYQGENDVGHYPSGSVVNNTGYACMEKLMIKQWRDLWSVVAETTDPMFHFSVVSLAAGTSEGSSSSMPGFRMSQSLNYDIMPNPVGVKTSIVQGYDIGDPWGQNCGNSCNKPSDPYSIETTQWKDGPIHPRPKIYVGQRFARKISKFVYGKEHIWSGPLIIGCSLANNKISIQFNKTMLYNETVIVQPWNPWYNPNVPIPSKWNAFQVLVNGKNWEYLSNEALKEGDDGTSVVLDVSQFGSIDGLRYAWNDYPCCGGLNLNEYPCPMNSCPVVTSESLLPAPPIWAKIENNKCVCYAPQEC